MSLSTMTISIGDQVRSAAIGEMAHSFNPNLVIETFQDMGVDIAFMQGVSSVFVVVGDSYLFDEIGEILEEQNIPIKMRMNEAIFVTKADMGSVLNAFLDA